MCNRGSTEYRTAGVSKRVRRACTTPDSVLLYLNHAQVA